MRPLLPTFIRQGLLLTSLPNWPTGCPYVLVGRFSPPWPALVPWVRMIMSQASTMLSLRSIRESKSWMDMVLCVASLLHGFSVRRRFTARWTKT
ncbi:hypothetical protein SODALDRAFT_378107, partial [Sodiomyces alkalinus F11]